MEIQASDLLHLLPTLMASIMMTPATSRIGRDARLLCDPLGIALLEALMSLATLDTSERVAV